jgi:hypothetical protein
MPFATLIPFVAALAFVGKEEDDDDKPLGRPAEGNDKTPPAKKRKATRDAGEVADKIQVIPTDSCFTAEAGSAPTCRRAVYLFGFVQIRPQSPFRTQTYKCVRPPYMQNFIEGVVLLGCVGVSCRGEGLVPGLCWSMLLGCGGRGVGLQGFRSIRACCPFVR